MTHFSEGGGAREPYSPDDIVVWPDGAYTELGLDELLDDPPG